KAAAELGAIASLVRSVGGADYRLPHTGYSVPAGIPAAALAAEDADLVEHLAAQGRIRMHLTLTPQSLPDSIGYNVVADLKGSEHPEQIVVVSGHLDSWDVGRGAIDDGAGVVISLATAELLHRLPTPPRVISPPSPPQSSAPPARPPPWASLGKAPPPRSPPCSRCATYCAPSARRFSAPPNTVPAPTSIHWWKRASPASASSRTAANISTITTAPPIRSTKSIRRICARTPLPWR